MCGINCSYNGCPFVVLVDHVVNEVDGMILKVNMFHVFTNADNDIATNAQNSVDPVVSAGRGSSPTNTLVQR